jgi:two-component sensor histidine kinase
VPCHRDRRKPALDPAPKSLGLRIVHILIRRLEASIKIENVNGTCFTITFPLEGEGPVEPRQE